MLFHKRRPFVRLMFSLTKITYLHKHNQIYVKSLTDTVYTQLQLYASNYPAPAAVNSTEAAGPKVIVSFQISHSLTEKLPLLPLNESCCDQQWSTAPSLTSFPFHSDHKCRGRFLEMVFSSLAPEIHGLEWAKMSLQIARLSITTGWDPPRPDTGQLIGIVLQPICLLCNPKRVQTLLFAWTCTGERKIKQLLLECRWRGKEMTCIRPSVLPIDSDSIKLQYHPSQVGLEDSQTTTEHLTLLSVRPHATGRSRQSPGWTVGKTGPGPFKESGCYWIPV